MSDEKQIKQAETVYNSLCEILDEQELNYDKHSDKLLVHFFVRGEDLPIDILATVDAERELVRVLSPLPFTFSEEKRVEGAIATCQANYNIVDGSFDYNFKNGSVLFRWTTNYKDSLISKDLFNYMLACVIYIVDDYNDKFLMLDKGMLTIEEFIKQS